MYKRFKKDLLVRWTVNTNGEPTPLEGRDLKLEMKDPLNRKSELPFVTDSNVIEFRFPASVQKVQGAHYFTLWENFGKDGQTCVDSCEPINLVSSTCQENDMLNGLDQDTVTLPTSSIEVGIYSSGGGTPLTKAAVEKVLTGDITSHNHATEIQTALEPVTEKLRTLEGKVPTKTSQLTNDSNFATQQQVKDEIAKAQLGGGGEVDTSGFATKEELAQALTNYVQKVLGKDLSTNDFTNVLKQKLECLENYDDAAMQQAIQTINTRIDTLVGTSASTAIDTFNEIEAFLAGITDTQSLTKLLSDLKSEITALIPSIEGLATKEEVSAVEGKIPTTTSQLQNDTNFVADASYVHTDNNFTTEEKQKLAGLQEGSGSQDNEMVVETVEAGFFVVDESLNVGAYVKDNDATGFGSGKFDVVQELDYNI